MTRGGVSHRARLCAGAPLCRLGVAMRIFFAARRDAER